MGIAVHFPVSPTRATTNTPARPKLGNCHAGTGRVSRRGKIIATDIAICGY